MALIAVDRGFGRGLLVALPLMAAAAQVHLDVKKGQRFTFYRIFLLFVAAPAGMVFFTALVVADNAVLFQRFLVFAVLKKNRPEVSFKSYDLRAGLYLSGSGKAAAAEKKAYKKHAGQQLCTHGMSGPVKHFCRCLIIAVRDFG